MWSEKWFNPLHWGVLAALSSHELLDKLEETGNIHVIDSSFSIPAQCLYVILKTRPEMVPK